eukprot:6568423-Ditylum_brightwellii.AAC.1
MGMDALQLYATQGEKHIRAILNHGNDDSITGKQLWACIERLKLEVGTSKSLFTNAYGTFKDCATDTWVKHTWKYMWEMGLVIDE